MILSQIFFCYIFCFRFVRCNVSYFAHAYCQVVFSNRNVCVYVTLSYVVMVSIVTVLNCNVFCHGLGLKKKIP